jgi:hypothetical protein
VNIEPSPHLAHRPSNVITNAANLNNVQHHPLSLFKTYYAQLRGEIER